ncbi:MAG: DciA family protein [Terriglobales bacterium]
MEALRAILASLPGGRTAAEVDHGAGLTLAWALAAGPRLAPRARCLELRAGILHLELVAGASASTRSQIDSIRGELVAALQRTLGDERIRSLQLH